MPVKSKRSVRKLPSTTSEDSDNSSSDDEPCSISAEVYEGLELHNALRAWHNRVRAVHELTACLERLYEGSMSKAAQGDVLRDVLAAVSIPDRRPAYREALAKLVKAAERVLPKQRRSQVLSEYKKATVALHRADRKQGAQHSEAGGGADDEEPHVVFELPLPEGVMRIIMAQLDPVALMRAAAVCRSWHELALDDQLWQHWMTTVFPKHNKAPGVQAQDGKVGGGAVGGETAPRWRRFSALAQDRPLSVLKWKTQRALVLGRLCWLTTEPHRQLSQAAQGDPGQSVGGRPHEPVHLTVEQVVFWLQHCRLDRNRHTSSSTECSSDDDAAGARKARLWALPADAR